MGGYVRESRLVPQQDGVNWNIKYGPKSAPIVTTAPIVAAESVLSYRSGSRYNPGPFGSARDIIESTTSRDYGRELGDYGHVFESSKLRYYTTHPRVKWQSPNGLQIWEGPVYLDSGLSASGWPLNPTLPIPLLSQAVINGYGSKAINSAAPTSAQADVLTALLELLREGLPKMLFFAIVKNRSKGKTAITRAFAEDYLNYMFGIAPLIREIEKTIDLVEKAEVLIRQMVRDSGRLVRRRRTLLEETSILATRNGVYAGSLSIPGGIFNASSSTQRLLPPNGYVTATQTLYKKVWFSGAFMYWLPSDYTDGTIDDGQSFDVLSHIAGLRSMPSTAWNLMPFSWLVDWFVNVGTIIGNSDNFQKYGLVMPYAYVMAEQRLITTYSFDMNNPFAGYPNRGTIGNSHVNTRKQRSRATPYGFGVTDAGITPIQASILTAIGITRGKSTR